jgi:hypothetical protein
MPIPQNFSLPKRSTQEYELLPEGMYQCEIVDITIKTERAWESDDEEDKFNFTFAIVDGQYKSRLLWKSARIIMSAGWEKGSPSWLYKIYCAAVGKKLTDDEAQGVSSDMINALIGKQVLLVVVQKPKKDGTLKNSIDNILTSSKRIDYVKKPQTTFTEEIETEAAQLQTESKVEEEVDVDSIPF